MNMSDINVSYQVSAAHSCLTAINQLITNTLDNRESQYQDIINDLEKSQCDHITTLKELINEEYKSIESLSGLYRDTIQMLKLALNDYVELENKYAINRVNN